MHSWWRRTSGAEEKEGEEGMVQRMRKVAGEPHRNIQQESYLSWAICLSRSEMDVIGRYFAEVYPGEHEEEDEVGKEERCPSRQRTAM